MRVLIVDDHPIVRTGLCRLLAGKLAAALSITEVAEAATVDEAIERLRAGRYDLVLLDINLPGRGGMELLEHCRPKKDAPRVIVLTVHANAALARRALQSGVSGYLSKSATPHEIIEAVRRVIAGGRYVENDIAQELALLAAEPSVMATDDPLLDLSLRDLEIVRQLAAGAALTEIADALGLSYKTVANACSRIKARFGVDRTTALVRIAVERGLGQQRA